MKLWDLYRDRDHRIVPTLSRIKEATDYVGNPERHFPAVLVGGTNGKGSTSAFLERILREHGLRTGWFVSPHLLRENERWRVNGEPIGDEDLKAYVKDLRVVFERFSLTYFEAATLIALLYFRDVKVDVAVMEVGMGGRWDATKVSRPKLVVITNAERDHTKWLGNSVEEIAEDKLHLSSGGTPLILGSSKYPLYTKALEMGLEPIAAGLDFTYSGSVKGWETFLEDYSFGSLSIKRAKLGLWGKWQVDNAALAVTASSLLIEIDTNKVMDSLERTRWEGRMEILRRKPLLIVDGSHNPYAVAKVVKEALKHFEVSILFSSLREKDWRLSLELIRRHTDTVYLTELSYHRAEPVKNMWRYAVEIGFKKVEILRSPSEVWEIDADILAVGSLYLVGEIKEARENSVI